MAEQHTRPPWCPTAAPSTLGSKERDVRVFTARKLNGLSQKTVSALCRLGWAGLGCQGSPDVGLSQTP